MSEKLLKEILRPFERRIINNDLKEELSEKILGRIVLDSGIILTHYKDKEDPSKIIVQFTGPKELIEQMTRDWNYYCAEHNKEILNA